MNYVWNLEDEMWFSKREKPEPNKIWVMRVWLRDGSKLAWGMPALSADEEKEFWKRAQGAGDGWFKDDNSIVNMGDVTAIMLERKS